LTSSGGFGPTDIASRFILDLSLATFAGGITDIGRHGI
jgi:hypothetical protein